MKVILKSDIEKVGIAGTIKNVKDGFARNYLFPRGLAHKATPEAIRQTEKTQDKRKALREKQIQELRDQAAKIAGTSLSFSRPAGAEGKIFGSVGKSDIAESLKASGFNVDKNAIILPAALKAIGEAEVEVRLHSEAVTKIKVSILARS